MNSLLTRQMAQPENATKTRRPGIWYKTEPHMFGVWAVKVWRDGKGVSGNDTGVRYWNTEREAWEHLLERAHKEWLAAQKELNRCDRNLAKAMKKLAPK